MSRDRRAGLAALAAGLVFGAGLLLSGMSRPSKVLAFLDPLGAFDPSLAFVMVGAICVYALAHRLSLRLSGPVSMPRFSRPPRRPIDAKLVLGAATFGVGWGLSGYCPGPAILSLGAGALGAAVFTVGLVAGTFVVGRIQQQTLSRGTAAPSGFQEADAP